MLQLFYHRKLNTNLCQLRKGLSWRVRISLTISWELRVVLSLEFVLTDCLRLREVYEKRLLLFVLPLPLIKTISQDDTALPFNHRVLQENDKMLKHTWARSILIKTKPAWQQPEGALGRYAPCRISLTAYSHCDSYWCCIASCLGHFPWTRQAPDPNAWRPTHTHPLEHSANKGGNKSTTITIIQLLEIQHVIFMQCMCCIMKSFPHLIKMSLWQQDGALGLWTLVVGGFVFIRLSIPPPRLPSPPRSVSIQTCSAHFVRSKGACGPSTHSPLWTSLSNACE